MKYSELIELYKTGKLPEETRQQVEQDIERQQAISEYLFDTEEIPDLDEFTSNYIGESTDESDSEDVKFIRIVRKSIHKAFIKMGVIVGAVLLAIVIFVIFALPRIVNLFYYDPTKLVKSEDAESIKFELDMAVYTELNLPGKYRDYVIADSEGYGEYTFNIINYAPYTEADKNVAGKIERNKLVMYEPDLLNAPAANVFEREIPGVEDNIVSNFELNGAAGSVENAFAELDNLKDNETYLTFITLNDVVSYTEFVEISEKMPENFYPIWCAICMENENGYYINRNIGFNFAVTCRNLAFDKEKYPNLTRFELKTTVPIDEIPSESVTTTHVVSMLRYMADQDDFWKLMGGNGDKYSEIADNVEQNGLNIYGYVAVADKAAIMEWSKNDSVAYIYTCTQY